MATKDIALKEVVNGVETSNVIMPITKWENVYGKKLKTINGNSIEGEGNIVVGGGGSEIPTITISQSQIVSLDPLQVQLTSEQYDICNSNLQVILNASALGYPNYLLIKANEDNNYLVFGSMPDVFIYDSNDSFSSSIANVSIEIIREDYLAQVNFNHTQTLYTGGNYGLNSTSENEVFVNGVVPTNALNNDREPQYSLKFWVGTQDEYDALSSVDSQTLYVIREEETQ